MALQYTLYIIFANSIHLLIYIYIYLFIYLYKHIKFIWYVIFFAMDFMSWRLLIKGTFSVLLQKDPFVSLHLEVLVNG